MKIFRPLAAVFFVFSLSLAVQAQESSEVAGLRAKAVKGNGIAQYNLGLAYAEGRGVTADSVEAFVWLSLARENGARGRALDTVVGSLDKASLERAQQRLTDRRAALGIRAPAPTAAVAHTEAPVEAPAPAGPPGPAPAAESRSAPPPATGEDPAAATLRGERDALAVRINNLSGDLAELRSERDRLNKLAGDNEKAARAAEARAAELARASEAAKTELAQTRQALATLQQAPKPAADTTALDAKTRELQAALTELEAAKSFGRQVEDTLNKVNDDRARVAAAAAAELEAAKNFGRQVEDTLNKVNDQKTALETQLTTARQELAAKPATPKYPDLSGRVTELETTLAKANTDLAASRKALAEKPAAPAYPDLSGHVGELETALAAARSAAPKYPDLRARVAELETQFASSQTTARERAEELARANTKLAGDETAFVAVNRELAAAKAALAQANQALAAKPAAPKYPDLSGRVTELESALAVARNAAPKYPDLSGRISELESQLAQAKQPVAPAYPDLRDQVGELESKITTLNSANTSARQQVAALTQAKETAEKALAAKPAAPKYPDLSGRVSELETALAKASTDLSATGSAKADLSGRVRELEAQVSAGSSAVAAAQAEAGRARQEVLALTKAKDDATAAKAGALAQVAALTQAKENAEKALAAKPNAPAYPDLSARVRELESALADSSRQLVALSSEATRAKQEVAALTKAKEDAQNAKPAAPAYPDLSGRVKELEGAVATALQKFGATEQARAEVSRQFDDYKNATATTQRDRTTLQSTLKMLESDKASLRRQVEAATAESNQLRTQVAALKTQAAAIKPAAPAYPDLSGKVAELEATLAAKPTTPAYPDLTARVGELETALAKASTDLSAAGSAKADLSRKVTELEARLAAKPTAPGYPDLSGRVSELETALAAVRNAAPKYPDLSGKVATLEAQLAAKPPAPSYPDLSAKVGELENRLAAAAIASQAAQAQAASLGAERDDARRARNELNDKVAKLVQENAALAASKAAPVYPDLRDRVASLESDLAASRKALAEKPAAPSYPDLSGRVGELETALAAARNAAPKYPDLSGKVTELQTALAAVRNAAPKYPDLSPRVSELEAQLAQAKQPAAPAYPNLADKVTELETKLAAATSDLSAATVAKTETAAQIAALTQAKAAAEKSVAALSSEAASARQQVAVLTKAKEDKPAAPAYPDLSGKVAELSTEVSQLRADRERMQKLLADSGHQLAEATTAARSRPVAPPGYVDRMRELETQLAQAKAAARNPAPAYPDLSGRVAELETKLAALASEAGQARQQVAALTQAKEAAEKSAAGLSSEAASAKQQVALLTKAKEEKPAAPAYPDLSGKVAELSTEVSQLRADRERMQKLLADSGRQLRDTTADAARIKELETQVAAARTQAGSLAGERDAARDTIARLEQEKARLAAAKPAAPKYPDLTARVGELESQLAKANTDLSAAGSAKADLSGKVTELETQLAQAKAAAPTGRAPAYPDLSGRVTELETALTVTKQQLAALQSAPAPAAASAGDTAELAKKLADTEDRLATSLRGYAALQRERDALAESAGKSAAAVTAERDSLAAQVTTLTGQVEQLRTAAQNSAGSTQAELVRLNEAVATLQRTSTQTSRDLAATRAVAQQLQGANTVLAGENYQLKTMLARTTGTAAPATAAGGTPGAVPAARTHMIVAGDSLSRISQRYYGTASRWQEIYNANATLLGPNGILKVGTELRIP